MINWLNYPLIGLLIILPAFFGYQGAAVEMGLIIGAIGLALFFVNIDKFQSFKGAGFEAQMREAVKETYAAIEQLQELALALTAPIVDEMAVSGNMFITP